MKQTVCVTGGSGGIGQALLRQLVAHYEVRVLFRNKTELSNRWQQQGCIPIWGSLEDDAALHELVKGARFVFHCAALVTQASYKEAYKVNVEGTRRLAKAAASNGCRRFIHLSSIAVYSGTDPAGDYTEDLPLQGPEGLAVYSATKLQSEQALQEVAEQQGLEYVILRPTFVYGPEVKSYTLVPLTLIRKGLPVIVGNGEGLMDAVYVDDVARAMVLSAESPKAPNQAFNIGHEAVTLNAFYACYATMLGRPARHLKLPLLRSLRRGVALLPGLPAEKRRELQLGAAFLLRTATNTKLFPCTKAKTLLNYQPAYSLEMGMLKTCLWATGQKLVSRRKHSLDFYGKLPFEPAAIVHPSCEEELLEVVRIAAERKVKVRAIGSLHSLSPIPYTDGICVVLDRYNKLVKVNGQMATVQAGMKVKELNHALTAWQLALPVSGTITAQTVAGAISTGTHGGSLHHGSLSDYVESVTLIKADGTLVQVNRCDDAFSAVLLSMGLFGIFSTVTFRCVPAFHLESRSSVRKAAEVLEQFEQIHQENLYVDMLYFTVTDEFEILTINRAELPTLPSTVEADIHATKPAANAKTGYFLKIFVLQMLAWVLRRGTPLQRYFTRFSIGGSYRPRKDRSDLVIAFGDRDTGGRSPGIIRDMEVAVPYQQARAAITAVRDHFRGTGRYPLLPIHIRCSARSELWLSPAYQQEICWLEFWQYPRTDKLLERIDELLGPFQYRFHWGKDTAADKAYISRQYERWEDFSALRAEWDPEGKFLNPYLESFFSR